MREIVDRVSHETSRRTLGGLATDAPPPPALLGALAAAGEPGALG